MPYELRYDIRCWDDVQGCSRKLLIQIRKAIETRLAEAPDIFGKPLKGRFKGTWRLRVGDYRILYRIEGDTVLILKIGHRSDVYKA